MNNSRPALHASRIFYLPDERSHKKDEGKRPGPNVCVSPLATPQGASGEAELRDCHSCANRADCMASVLRKGPFALDVCEMQTSKRPYNMTGAYTGAGMRRAADRASIVEAIRARKSFCAYDIHKDTGLHSSTINGHLTHLMTAGMIRRIGRTGSSGTPIMYELVEET
jgi:hypothetical protein